MLEPSNRTEASKRKSGPGHSMADDSRISKKTKKSILQPTRTTEDAPKDVLNLSGEPKSKTRLLLKSCLMLKVLLRFLMFGTAILLSVKSTLKMSCSLGNSDGLLMLHLYLVGEPASHVSVRPFY